MANGEQDYLQLGNLRYPSFALPDGGEMAPIPVLLVDDNLTFLRILENYLQELHHDEVVVVGSTGQAEVALAKAKNLRPEVILLDLAMPGLPGLEAIPQLRGMLPGTGIIALTLLEATAYREAALAAGADAFVPKATLHTDLLPAIRRVVQANRTTQAVRGRSC
jgi:DNA-binding NarL/FixJ family response regulator